MAGFDIGEWIDEETRDLSKMRDRGHPIRYRPRLTAEFDFPRASQGIRAFLRISFLLFFFARGRSQPGSQGTSFSAPLEASALVHDMVGVTVVANAQGCVGFPDTAMGLGGGNERNLADCAGLSGAAPILDACAPRRSLHVTTEGRCLKSGSRQIIIHREFEAARHWVERQTLALRDAARAELQGDHASIVFREAAREDHYRFQQHEIAIAAQSCYDQQIGQAQQDWEQQHVAIV